MPRTTPATTSLSPPAREQITIAHSCLPLAPPGSTAASTGRITMRDVARQAGLSTTAVSSALSNGPGVSRATAERVREIAERLGYRPNPYVSALMRARRMSRARGEEPVIALISALERADAWRRSPAQALREQREGAIEQARIRGHRPEEFWLHQDGMSNRRFSDMLRARDIQAVLIGPAADGAPALELQWENFSVVSLGVPQAFPAVSTVCNDHYHSSLRAMEEIHRRRYLRPGLVMRRSHHERFHGRWDAGFKSGQRTFAALHALPLLLVDDWEDRGVFETWMRACRPDVVITPNAPVVEEFLAALGRRAPRDVGLVSLSCPEIGDRVSGVCQNARLIGANAIDLLLGMVARNERGLPAQAQTLMVEGRWNPGRTLRPLAGENRRPAAPPADGSDQAQTQTRRVSLKDVAREAGVAKATVSLALRGNPAISASTVERVRCAAGRLGYRVNPYVAELMRSLRRGRVPGERPALALVRLCAADCLPSQLGPTVEQIHRGACERAAACGYRLDELTCSWARLAEPDFDHEMEARGVRGLLLWPDQLAPAGYAWPVSGRTALGIGVSTGSLPIPTVCNDHYFSALRAVQECHRRGYRRPGFISHRAASDRFQRRWLAGFEVAQGDLRDLHPVEPLICGAVEDEVVLDWFARTRPDVIVSPNDLMAGEIRATLGRVGCRTPEHVGLISLSCLSPEGEYAGIFQNGPLIGASAIDWLISQLEFGERGPPPPAALMIEGRWVEGATLRSMCPTGSPAVVAAPNATARL